MKNFVKLAVCAVLIASVLCVTTQASSAADQVRIDLYEMIEGQQIGGNAMLKCFGPDGDYVTYTETVANGRGSDPDDYVAVYLQFIEYNRDLDALYEKENDGPNYIMAWLDEIGYNPDQVYSIHVILRGDTFYMGDALIRYDQ